MSFDDKVKLEESNRKTPPTIPPRSKSLESTIEEELVKPSQLKQMTKVDGGNKVQPPPIPARKKPVDPTSPPPPLPPRPNSNQSESPASKPPSSPGTIYVSPRSFSSTATSSSSLSPLAINLPIPKTVIDKAFTLSFIIDTNFAQRTPPFFFDEIESKFTFSVEKSTLVKDVFILKSDIVIVVEMMNLRAYSLLNSQPLWTLQPADYLKPNTACLMNNKSLLVMGTGDGHIFFINPSNGALLAEHLAAHGKNIVANILYDSFKENGNIYSIDESGKMLIWNQAGKKLSERVLPVCTKNIIIVEEDDSSSFVVVYGNGPSLFFVSIENQRVEEINDPSLALSSITSIHRYSQDLVLTGHDDGRMAMWDIKNKTIKSAFILSNYRIEVIISSVGQNCLWIGDSYGVMRVVDIDEKIELLEWKWHSSAISKITMGDELIITLDNEGNFGFWDRFLMNYKMSKEMLGSIESFSDKESLNLRICSWNIGSAKPPIDNDFFNEWADSEKSDILVIGLQEIISLDPRSGDSNAEVVDLWVDRLKSILVDYALIYFDGMVGLLMLVFLRDGKEKKNIKVLESNQIKTGLGGLYGNKGALAVRFILNDTSFCFINCHLPSGQEGVSARNTDLGTIIESIKFSTLSPLCSHSLIRDRSGTSPLDHQNLFIFGDLNYRIVTGEDNEQVLQSIHDGNFEKLVDQLFDQKIQNPFHPLSGFTEAKITFRPTYKYERFTSTYNLQRCPAWCDRVLYKSPVKGIECTEYQSVDSMMISDHKPISCAFTVNVYRVDRKKQKQVYLIKKLELEQN
jgi:hypothetical protein